MAERRIRLLAEQTHCKIPNIRQTREDLKQIYGPHYAKLPDKLFGLFMARPINEDARPDFRVRAALHDFESMWVSTGDISLPGPAAGWAALQLYQNKRNIFPESVLAMDTSIAGGIRGLGRLTRDLKSSEITPVQMWLHGRFPNAQTGIRIQNEGRRTLNDMLEALHKSIMCLNQDRVLML